MQRPNHVGRRIPLVIKKLLPSLSCMGGRGAAGCGLCGKKEGKRVDTAGRSIKSGPTTRGLVASSSFCIAPSTHTQDTHHHQHRQTSIRNSSFVAWHGELQQAGMVQGKSSKCSNHHHHHHLTPPPPPFNSSSSSSSSSTKKNL